MGMAGAKAHFARRLYAALKGRSSTRGPEELLFRDGSALMAMAGAKAHFSRRLYAALKGRSSTGLKGRSSTTGVR
jgi:hypothetical protein